MQVFHLESSVWMIGYRKKIEKNTSWVVHSKELSTQQLDKMAAQREAQREAQLVAQLSDLACNADHLVSKAQQINELCIDCLGQMKEIRSRMEEPGISPKTTEAIEKYLDELSNLLAKVQSFTRTDAVFEKDSYDSYNPYDSNPYEALGRLHADIKRKKKESQKK